MASQSVVHGETMAKFQGIRRRAMQNLAKPAGCGYKHARRCSNQGDLHDVVLFADRSCASVAYAGCLYRPLTAFFDSIDRADGPTLRSQ